VVAALYNQAALHRIGIGEETFCQENNNEAGSAAGWQ
jgi:hypothetical protein